MSGWQKCFQGLGFLFLLVVGAIALSTGIRSRTSQTVEIVSYQAAVKSQSKAQALNFISTFSSSHLLGDLIVSLKPEVAEQVCADLQGSGPRKTRIACEVLRETLTVQRSATATKTGPAADIAMVNPAPSGAVTSVASNDEPRDRQDVVSTAGAGGTDLLYFYRQVAATVPAEGVVTARAVRYGTIIVGIVLGDGVAAVTQVLASAVTSVPPNDEPRGGQGGNDTDMSDGSSIFSTAWAAPTVRSTAVLSASISTSASGNAPSGSDPTQSDSSENNGDQSASAQSDSGKKGSAHSGSGKKGSAHSGSGKKGSVQNGSGEKGSAQNGSGKKADGKGGKDKGGKDKGGKDKGGKDKGGKDKGGKDKGGNSGE